MSNDSRDEFPEFFRKRGGRRKKYKKEWRELQDGRVHRYIQEDYPDVKIASLPQILRSYCDKDEKISARTEPDEKAIWIKIVLTDETSD